LFQNGKTVVVAVDHGLFDGPISGLEDMRRIGQKIHPEINGVLLSAGMMRQMDELFVCRDGPMPIIRLNWSAVYCFTWDYHSGETGVAIRPQDALRLGADTVLVSLSLRTGDEGRDARNVDLFARLCRESHDFGLAVIGEYFPVHSDSLSEEDLHKEIQIGARILCELGADAIKTFHTNRFHDVVAGCAIPILTLGGKKYPTALEALQAAARQLTDGAAGVVFGRNVVQTDDPLAFQSALIDVVRKGIAPESAASMHGIS
jgi:DhnA family fructose-bisphosphate aldolase class Ia